MQCDKATQTESIDDDENLDVLPFASEVLPLSSSASFSRIPFAAVDYFQELPFVHSEGTDTTDEDLQFPYLPESNGRLYVEDQEPESVEDEYQSPSLDSTGGSFIVVTSYDLENTESEENLSDESLSTHSLEDFQSTDAASSVHSDYDDDMSSGSSNYDDTSSVPTDYEDTSTDSSDSDFLDDLFLYAQESLNDVVERLGLSGISEAISPPASPKAHRIRPKEQVDILSDLVVNDYNDKSLDAIIYLEKVLKELETKRMVHFIDLSLWFSYENEPSCGELIPMPPNAINDDDMVDNVSSILTKTVYKRWLDRTDFTEELDNYKRKRNMNMAEMKREVYRIVNDFVERKAARDAENNQLK